MSGCHNTFYSFPLGVVFDADLNFKAHMGFVTKSDLFITSKMLPKCDNFSQSDTLLYWAGWTTVMLSYLVCQKKV